MVEVGHKVLLVLNSRCITYEIIHNAKFLSFGHGHIVERERNRMIDKALDATKARTEIGQLEVIDEPQRLVKTAFDEKTHHTAETSHLFLGYGVVRMCLKTRVIYMLNSWMVLEKSRNGEPVSVMFLDPDRQRF